MGARLRSVSVRSTDMATCGAGAYVCVSKHPHSTCFQACSWNGHLLGDRNWWEWMQPSNVRSTDPPVASWHFDPFISEGQVSEPDKAGAGAAIVAPSCCTAIDTAAAVATTTGAFAVGQSNSRMPGAIDIEVCFPGSVQPRRTANSCEISSQLPSSSALNSASSSGSRLMRIRGTSSPTSSGTRETGCTYIVPRVNGGQACDGQKNGGG